MAEDQRSNAKAGVKKKLQELSQRVPGRVTVPATDKQTLIAGQLVKITDDLVFLQMEQDTYGIPIPAIEDIREIVNPIEIERVSGVDVVITVSNRATIETRVADFVRNCEVPFALVNPQTVTPTSDEEHEVLRTRTERWLKLNGMVFEMSQRIPGGYNTAMCMCSAMTATGSAGMVCDCYDRYPEVFSTLVR